ncbi:MAG: hypothetical protein AAFW68_00485 [Pseudomonadota bacterium]
MSDRVQIGDVLNEAFQFGYQRWTTVFRFAWLPIVLSMLVAYGVGYLVLDMQAVEAASDSESTGDLSRLLKAPPGLAVLIGLAGGVLSLAIFSGPMASIYRLVALGEERPGFAQLRFDGPAQRVFWGQLILSSLSLAVSFVAVILMLALNGFGLGDVFNAGSNFVSLVSAASNDPAFQPTQAQIEQMAPIGAAFLGVIVAAPVLIYLNIKLAPFLPGSAAKNRLFLFGAFRMTTGYFWLIFGLYVLFILAMLVVAFVYMLVMSFLEVMAGLGGGGALALISGLFGLFSVAVGLAYQVFVIGVQMSLQAIVYRRLETGQ